MDEFSKRYYKISEVSEMLGVPMSTLRFWEGRLKAIKPQRNDKGTRKYTPQDVETLRMVHFLVKNKGMHLEAVDEEMRRNRDGVSKRIEAIEGLKKVREELKAMIDSLHKLR